MRLSTLALNNIKRNFKKYVMYFFSLGFSVFTAYTFIALMENETISSAYGASANYQSMLHSFGVIIMIFVLFFLVSSNKSFIKARKKELSTYALFGMSNNRIGRLLFIETMMVGITALVIGIGAGVFFSKLVSMILLNTVVISLTTDIVFTVSFVAIYKTAIIFISIFIIMGCSGFRIISKFELVDLFKAQKVSEGKVKGSNIALVVSIVLIGFGYYLALIRETQTIVLVALPVIVLVISGTYLFFWGGFIKINNLIKRRKASYYKASNLISIAAFSHRIKSIGSVMATIAVLSAIATTAIAVAYTLYSNVEESVYNTCGYDMYVYNVDYEVIKEIDSIFLKYGIDGVEQLSLERYLIRPTMEPLIINDYEFFPGKHNAHRVYSESTYNELVSRSKANHEQVKVKQGESVYIYRYMDEEMENGLKGAVLSFENKDIKITSVLVVKGLSFGATDVLVVNDDDFNELIQDGDIITTDENGKTIGPVVVYNYKGALKQEEVAREFNRMLSDSSGRFTIAFIEYIGSMRIYGLLSFIGFFMSAVFILMTASLLYFKQIMAAEEEKEQYAILRKIGMDAALERKVIMKRLLPVFLIPLVVGIIHSIFAMRAADTLIFSTVIPVENSYEIVLKNSVVMYAVYSLVYGLFYFITKAQYSKIVR